LDRLIIEAGNHADSELWIRDASLSENRMPPISRNVIDQMYVDSLAKWIDGLSEELVPLQELQIFPNPSSGWLIVRLPDYFDIPAKIDVFNISGQLIQTFDTNNYSATISMTQFSPGSYFVQVRSGDNVEAKKFILN